MRMLEPVFFTSIISTIFAQHSYERVWWQKANVLCNKTGSNLVSIHSHRHNQLVYDYCLNELHWHCWIGLYAPSCVYNYSTYEWVGEFNGTWNWIDGSTFDYSNFCDGFPQKGSRNDSSPNVCDGGTHIYYDINRNCWRNGWDGVFDETSDEKWWKFYICNNDIIQFPNSHSSQSSSAQILFNETIKNSETVLIEIENGVGYQLNMPFETIISICLGLFVFLIIFWFGNIIRIKVKNIETTIAQLSNPHESDTDEDVNDEQESISNSYPHSHISNSDNLQYDFCDVLQSIKYNHNDDVDENQYDFCTNVDQ